MSNLGPQYINQTFGYLLQIPGGLTSTLTAVSDGNGNNLPLSASTTGITATITGGSINGSAIGGTTPAAGTFTSLNSAGSSFSASAPSGSLNLDANGNLGLGVVPSGWGSTWKALQIGTTGSVASGVASTDVQIGSNFYNTGTGTSSEKYIASDYASMYRQISGQHQWYTAPSGTAGSAIGFTQAMMLTAAGYLGIGTSSPASILNVSGGNITVDAGKGIAYSGDQTRIFTPEDNVSGGLLQWSSSGILRFMAGASNERMRLDSSGNLGIGTTANASAILDAQSTTKGVRFPNMTTTQKNAISSPAAGLVVFDTTLAKLCVYSGSAWQTITSV